MSQITNSNSKGTTGIPFSSQAVPRENEKEDGDDELEEVTELENIGYE